ncbi:E3 ubiquitin-protein ligase PPP1R11 [Atheta coriaria]|uniref:E3 ubiquitin-protein ligase PPP1R11 n=1 Tax=Dalotia coriaria TaxID=877792 RepID=UPI0031F3F6DD
MADPSAGNSQSQHRNVEGTTSTTITIDRTDAQTQEATVQLKLRKASGDRKVKWSSETVDNEHMDKKKSKCCCIYKKARPFGESSSEDDSDDECDHHHAKPKRDKTMNTEDTTCEMHDPPLETVPSE